MIKTKNLSYKNLKKLNIQERIEAAKTPGIGQTLMSALTPTQIAELFPRYYLMREPDISGFLKAMPTSMSAARQAQFQEQLQNTASGEASGKNMESGGWRRKLQQGVNESATVLKPGQSPAPKLTPEQLATVNLLVSGKNIAADDPSVKFISTLSPEQLKTVGLEKYKGEGDKEFYKYLAPQISDEEVKKRLSSDVIQGTEGLKGTAAMQKRVYDAYKEAGFSHNQSLALTAEVGRENGYRESVMFGTHVDPANSATNLGMISMQGSRHTGLYNFMKSKNLINENGGIIHSQESLVAMAQYQKKEMQNDSSYSRTRKEFLENRNINPEAAAEILGNNYIRWRYDDPRYAHHHEYRRNYLRQIENTTQSMTRDPITGDYSKEQIVAERERLSRDIYSKRITSLAEFSKADLPVPGSPEAQQFFSDGKSESAVRKRISELTGMESSECVALAKAYVGSTGTVKDWRRGNSVLDGNLRPGTPIATFMDRSGGPSDKYDGGVGSGKRRNDTTHAAVFIGYERDQSGKITGIKVADQWATSGGVKFRTFPIEGKTRITSARNFYAINNSKGEPLGESNPMRIAKQAQEHQGGPKIESVAEGRVKTSVTESAAQTLPEAKPGEHLPAPHGQHTLGDHPKVEAAPKPVEQKKEEPKTIKQFVKGEGYATIKDVPNPKYVPPSEPPKTEPSKTGVGINRVEESLKAPDKSSKPGDVNPQPQGQNKLAEPVKTNSKGGSNRTHTDQITALPIGGIKDDNSVVVDANKQPLFTMNTDKESAVYDPVERKVDVVPNKKTGEIGRMPERTQATVEMKSDIVDTKDGTHKPQDITKGSESHISDRDPHMIDQILDMTRNIFLDPSAARAFSRARFHETGDATNDFHHSTGNSNML
jgi:hypothetical protein